MPNDSGCTYAEPPTEPELLADKFALPPAPAAISVDIYDQVYHLRGTDPAYIEHLARTVDAKMRAVSAHGCTVDSLRVAVLAALNIADELESLRERHETLAGSISESQRNLRSRAGSLAHLLDDVLDQPVSRKVG